MRNRSAFSFVLIIGIVNFFADLTYEGARGIVGPFLGSLGASAAIVGFIAGFGELIGYALRSVSGYFADKTQKYWFVTFTGYAINMLAVPALALAGQWPLAAGLVVAERTGRAIRKPVVEAMLSHAGRSIGAGWVFGLNEALDQAGATIGPLLIALILFLKGGLPNWFWRIAHSGIALSGHFGRSAVLTSSPTGFGGIVGAASCDALPDAALLGLSCRRRVDRSWFCGFRVDRISFPKRAHGPDKSDSRLLRSRDGQQCARRAAIWPLVRQVRRQYCPARISHFRGICAFCFSGHILFRIDRDDPLGDRDERTRIAAPGDVDRRNPAGKA